MRFLIRKFLDYRDVFAVAMLFCGLPIVYFFRDGLKLAPNSAAFTVAGALGPLIMTIPFKNLRKLYVPNPLAYFLTMWFVIITFLYLLFRDKYSAISGTYELLSYTFIFFIFYAFVMMSADSLNNNFLPIALTICAIGSLLLLYSVYKDPFYVIGQRAAIKFREEEEGNTGNPHIFSKVAFFGLILSTMMLKYQKQYKTGMIFTLGTMLLFIVVLFLTQTMITFITSAIFLWLFFIFNFSFKSLFKSVKSLLTKWYVLIVLGFGVYKVVVLINENEDALAPVTSFVSYRFEKLVGTLTGALSDDEASKVKDVDVSASMRVNLIAAVFEDLEENVVEGKLRYVFWGNGYKNLYVDVPIFEVLDSFGIIMFIFYMVIYFYLTKICILEMRNPSSIAAEFIAYGYIYFLILNLTGGYVMDYTRWGYYAVVARFIPGGLLYVKSKVETNKTDSEPQMIGA
jgi:hypothetical protein